MRGVQNVQLIGCAECLFVCLFVYVPSNTYHTYKHQGHGLGVQGEHIQMEMYICTEMLMPLVHAELVNVNAREYKVCVCVCVCVCAPVLSVVLYSSGLSRPL